MAAVNSATSFIISSIMTLLIFSGMQMYKPLLVKSPTTIILGGYLGSVMFMFFVTSIQAIGNLEATLFGKNFQLKLPELMIAFLTSLIAAGTVHRICFTTCFIFSLTTIYYLNKLSQKAYSASATVAATAPLKTRKHK